METGNPGLYLLCFVKVAYFYYLRWMHLSSLIIKCFAEKIEKVAKNPSQSVISEIRSYAKPPKAVHDIMLCVYLLLGDEEDQLKVRIDILWKVYSCKIKIFLLRISFCLQQFFAFGDHSVLVEVFLRWRW